MSFDLLAPYYRGMEFICAGEKMQRCRTRFLDEIPAAHSILLLGEGHGRGLHECAWRFASAAITCVDASQKMLKQSRRHLARYDLANARVQFIHADVLNWTPPRQNYDLIVTNFFLDCFQPEQLEQIVQNIATITAPNASWLISDFQNAPAGLSRLRSRMILWILYRFFRATTRLPAKELTAPDPFLERAGFRLHRRVESDWNLLRSDWWQRPPIISTQPNRSADAA
jgi:ubiquinone/menaquinone biosynthesis C-methylase UbiE